MKSVEFNVDCHLFLDSSNTTEEAQPRNMDSIVDSICVWC